MTMKFQKDRFQVEICKLNYVILNEKSKSVQSHTYLNFLTIGNLFFMKVMCKKIFFKHQNTIKMHLKNEFNTLLVHKCRKQQK